MNGLTFTHSDGTISRVNAKAHGVGKPSNEIAHLMGGGIEKVDSLCTCNSYFCWGGGVDTRDNIGAYIANLGDFNSLGDMHFFIFFAEVKNDGFNLGAQRTALDTSDLPKLSKDIVESSQNDLIEHVKKQKLLENKDFSLTLSRYIEAPILTGIFYFVPLSKVSSISNGYSFKRDRQSI